MDINLSEKELLRSLQGHWECNNGMPNFEIAGKKVIINGGISGIGIPGLDNIIASPLLLKWDDELKKWQIFSGELGWLLTFIDEISEDYFTVKEYDMDKNIFGEPIRLTRATGEY
jgi:hypothetical protein